MTASSGFDAVYLDGRTASRRAVRASVVGTRLVVEGEGVAQDIPLDQVRVQRTISGERCNLALPDGAQLRTGDMAAIDAAFGTATRDAFVRRLEGRWSGALLGLALLAVAALWTWRFGLPMAATFIAHRMPTQVKDNIGGHALATLDKTVCHLSSLTPAGQDELEAATLKRVLGDAPDAESFAMDFRLCPAIGANALALPAARIVVTDDLVKLAGRDTDLLAAVVAHEVGHIRHDHALRMSLQATGVAVVIATLASDAVSITGLAAALPAVFLQTGYSREFEAEADDYALARLKEMGIPPARFADMLERLEASHAGRNARSGGNDYFSTHPATAARVAKARAYR